MMNFIRNADLMEFKNLLKLAVKPSLWILDSQKTVNCSVYPSVTMTSLF
jgi:hypothetical protein